MSCLFEIKLDEQSLLYDDRDTMRTVEGREQVFQSLRVTYKGQACWQDIGEVAWLTLCALRNACEINMAARANFFMLSGIKKGKDALSISTLVSNLKGNWIKDKLR